MDRAIITFKSRIRIRICLVCQRVRRELCGRSPSCSIIPNEAILLWKTASLTTKLRTYLYRLRHEWFTKAYRRWIEWVNSGHLLAIKMSCIRLLNLNNSAPITTNQLLETILRRMTKRQANSSPFNQLAPYSQKSLVVIRSSLKFLTHEMWSCLRERSGSRKSKKSLRRYMKECIVWA